MKVKLRAVEVHLSNGEVQIVHEPRMQDLGVFLRALPSLMVISRAMAAVNMTEEGVIGAPVDIPPAAVEGIHPLFAVMCDMTVEDFKNLPVWDGIGVLNALGQFVPNESGSGSEN